MRGRLAGGPDPNLCLLASHITAHESPAELSGHAVWIRLCRRGLPSGPLPAHCTEQPRGVGGRCGDVGCMWLPRCLAGGRGLLRYLWLWCQGVVVSPAVPSPSQLSSKNPIRSHRAHTRPTHHSSLANSPIKTYYYGTHILPSLNHLPLSVQEFLFAKAGNTSPLRHLAQKAVESRKKGRGVRI